MEYARGRTLLHRLRCPWPWLGTPGGLCSAEPARCKASDSASARILTTNLSRLVLPPDPVTRTCPRHDQVEKKSTLVAKGHRFRGRFPGHAGTTAPEDHCAAYLGAFGAVATSAQQSAYSTSARFPLSMI